MISNASCTQFTVCHLSDVDVSALVYTRAHRTGRTDTQGTGTDRGRGGSGLPESQGRLYSIFSRNTRGIKSLGLVMRYLIVSRVALAIANVVRQWAIPALRELLTTASAQNRGAVSGEKYSRKDSWGGISEPGTRGCVPYSPDSVVA